jgi:hypothetical protein
MPMADRETRPERASSEFERLAEKRSGENPISEFRYLLARTRKYWMVPIILSLLLVGGLLMLAATTAGPLIYALF